MSDALGQEPYQIHTALAHPDIYALLTHHATHQPDAIAIAAPGRIALTYSNLLQQVKSVLGDLRTVNIGQQDCLAVVLPNGPEMAVAFLAIAAAATCAPLNPAYRASEFEFYLSDLQANALIVQAGIESPAIAVAQALNIPIIYLHPHPTAAAGTFHVEIQNSQFKTQTSNFNSSTDTLNRVSTQHPTPNTETALVLHTSGTTSRPKIVPLTHTNLCTSAHTIAQTLKLQPGDCCLNVMPLFHIHGLVGALLSSISAGGSVVCTPGFVASQFCSWLEQFSPTWYSAVPTIHQAILEQASGHASILSAYPLRFIRSSSAALPQRVLAQLEATFNAPVIEAYGMTEAAHQMASNPLPPEHRKPGSVGLAAGPEVAIMDEVGNLLPQGKVGEVVIQGANVTPGYANNPEANANAFTNGWFRTGDQGYMDADGYLFLNGRLKEIINRGGEKIAPQEIDNLLMQLPDVQQAVTFAVPHPSLGEDIASAVVLSATTSLTAQTIRQFLFEHLADFKVPSQVIIVDAIPKGPTGKLQRIGLAERLAEQLKAPFAAPRNLIESFIAEMMTDVLGLDQLSIFDNFFSLGGDSLQGTRLITQINSILVLDLPAVLLFQKPTVAELSDEIRNSTDATHYDSILNVLEELNHLTDEDAQQLVNSNNSTVGH